MYNGHSVIAIIPARDEQSKICRVVERIDSSYIDTILVVDDASSDSTPSLALRCGVQVLSLTSPCGVGAAIRAGLEFGRATGHQIAVILAGNNKDEPAEIPILLDPICSEEADFVMGSRYMPGGSSGGCMPFYRKLATRLHPWLMSIFCGKKLTESTNGFRAMRLSMLDDPRIELGQRWLNHYGLEVYLLWKAITLGYKHVEVPCTKTYPSRKVGYTKMKPIIGWWSILRPVFLLGLGVRK